MHQIHFGWGCASDPVGKLTVILRPLAAIKGPASQGREGYRGGRGGKGKAEEGGEGSGGDPRVYL